MRSIMIGGVVLGLVGVAAAGWMRFATVHSQQSLHNQEVVRVMRRDVGTQAKATGIIKPMIGAEVNVGSSVSGVVMRLFVQIGDHVDKGQPLAELDSRALKARRDADAAALQVAQANLDYAEVDLRRKRQLSAAQIISRSDLDLAEKAFAVAGQQRDQAKATLADSTTQLGFTQIVAPIAGVVSAVSTQEGETVAASFAAPTFVTLLDLSKLEVWSYVDETDIGHIHIGQQAHFTVDTYGDHEFHGTVTSIHPKAEIRDNVVDYVVVVRFAPPRDFILRPDMTTTVTVDLERRANVLSLPIRAVRRQANRAFALCRDNGKTEQRWISTGIRDDAYWEIVAGLHDGDEVLIGDAIRSEEIADVIEMHEISKTYRRPTGEAVEALIDVSLEIEDGEFVAIVGSSGSGKSTLMNILGLLDVPSAGSYRLRGQETARLAPGAQAQWRNKRIGFVFQTFHLLPRTSALENVELPLLYSERNDIRGLGRKALELVGLSDRVSHRPSELSGGQQQRVAIARALVNEPDLLLADEPTGNLDRRSADEVMAIFEDLNRAGRTIVVVTHDAEVANHCQRIARIERGRIVTDERIAAPRTAFEETL